MDAHPSSYLHATRTLLRYAIVMALVALLAGIAYQESAGKLPPGSVEAGLRLEAVRHLSLVHGHLFVVGVLLPVALLGMLHLARAAGGREVGPRTLAWSLGLFLPSTAVALALQLAKGYHVLLAVRAGEGDLAAIDARFLGGATALRYAVHGISHGGMGLGLVVLLVSLWRSLRRRDA